MSGSSAFVYWDHHLDHELNWETYHCHSLKKNLLISNHTKSLLPSWPSAKASRHPTASRKGRTEQPAKIHSKDHCHVALVLYDSSPVLAHFSVATGTCRPCQLSYLDAHLLHYPPGPHKAGCCFEMKMWTWVYKRQVVSVTGITLSLGKSTQTFLKNRIICIFKNKNLEKAHISDN